MEEKELKELYAMRLRDRRTSRTKRRRHGDQIPDKVGSLLTQYFSGDEAASRRFEESRAVVSWEKFVGPAVAQVSEALRVRSGKLVVQVKDPLWMQELSLVRHSILKRYQKSFPKLGLLDIFFVR